jgi:hypothetical protein
MVTRLSLIDAYSSNAEYVLETDVEELHLSDEQVRRAIGKARQCRGERVDCTSGQIERYVEIDGLIVPVMGCRR